MKTSPAILLASRLSAVLVGGGPASLPRRKAIPTFAPRKGGIATFGEHICRFAAVLALVILGASGCVFHVTGHLEFFDERVNTLPNQAGNTGSLLTASDVDRPLPEIRYSLAWGCSDELTKSFTGFADETGTLEESFYASCSRPRIRLHVSFEGERYGGTDSFMSIQRTGADGRKSLGAYLGESPVYQLSSRHSELTLNVSCPAVFPYAPGPACAPGGDGHEAANLFATALDVIDVWGAYRGPAGRESPRPMEIRYPCTNCTSASGGYDTVIMPANSFRQNHRLAHEIGHTYHKRAVLDGPGSLAGGKGGDWIRGHTWNNCRIDDDDPNDGADTYPEGNQDGWSESCATSEGWADFFAGATYFTPTATAPYHRYCRTLAGCPNIPTVGFNPTKRLQRLEGPTFAYYRYLNSGHEQCLGVDATNYAVTVKGKKPDIDYQHALQGNVARWFWDLYDDSDNLDPSNDNVVFPPSYMLTVWESFDPGRGNRQRLETRDASGWDDPDGRNAVDYRKVECNNIDAAQAQAAGARGHCELVTEFNANCLGDQDEG